MAYVNASNSIALRGARPEGFLAQIGAAFARRRLYARTLNELRQLSDRELSDLGISRLSIAQVAHEAAYGK